MEGITVFATKVFQYNKELAFIRDVMPASWNHFERVAIGVYARALAKVVATHDSLNNIADYHAVLSASAFRDGSTASLSR